MVQRGREGADPGLVVEVMLVLQKGAIAQSKWMGGEGAKDLINVV